MCFDAKINFDDNAEFRQKSVFAMDDMAESDPREVEASRHNLNYIGMDGNIACLGKFSTLVFIIFQFVSSHFLCAQLLKIFCYEQICFVTQNLSCC